MRGKRHGFVGHLPLSDRDADAGARHSTADQVRFIIVAGAEEESKTSSQKLSNRARRWVERSVMHLRTEMSRSELLHHHPLGRAEQAAESCRSPAFSFAQRSQCKYYT